MLVWPRIGYDRTAVISLIDTIAGEDEKASNEHCTGMKGLVAEATKHFLEKVPDEKPLLDELVLAQY